ncbi:MAG: rod shape-determining protein MreC [Flavobacteriales bacterium]|nr:rod shape-determining protein MreC [Flavobacteriales bacterium]MBP6574360.1 rod shape-determining protein MreC [Flavobacteriales bacterium]
MRDLFRFLWRSRSTLLFIGLMVLSFLWLANGNDHHRAQTFTSSQAAIGTLYGWRDQVVRYTDLDGENEILAAAQAEMMNRMRSSYLNSSAPFVVVNDTLLQQQYKYISTRVLNSTTSKQKNFLTLDKGGKAGLAAGMGVIAANGIVGVVRECSPRFSTVTSVLNSSWNISVLNPRTEHFGLLNWDTADPTTARVKDIPKHARIVVGDTIVTGGDDRVFPKGVPVGVVESVVNDDGAVALDIIVRLSHDMTRIGHVWVVTDLLKLERDTLEAKLDAE